MLRNLTLAAAAATIATVGMASAADLPSKKGPAAAVAPAPMFFVNDNTISYSYQFNATDPGVKGKFGKNVFTFTHFDVWAMGTNFFTVDLLKSPLQDPASGGNAGNGSASGDTAVAMEAVPSLRTISRMFLAGRAGMPRQAGDDGE